jgi:DNA invertase Pin-like site-specific DNA recombinase
MFQMMGVFAEFERSVIVERVRAGVARAKASGTKSGKSFGRPRTAPEVEHRIREALATPGRPGFHKIAAQFGVATGTGSKDRERLVPARRPRYRDRRVVPLLGALSLPPPVGQRRF